MTLPMGNYGVTIIDDCMSALDAPLHAVPCSTWISETEILSHNLLVSFRRKS